MDTSRLGQAMHKAEAAFPISPSSYRPIKVAVKERFLSCVTPTPASVELHQSCLLDYSLLPISRPKGLSLLPRISRNDVYKGFIIVPNFLNFFFFLHCLFIY
jgi:hypothetical protein